MPEPTPEVAEQMTYLREELGMDGLASAISSRPAQEQVALSKQVTETLDQISQLEKNRTALRAQNDKSSADAVGEQIRKLENSIDDLQYSLTDVPNTREKVQEAIKANGNATEANKISTDIRKDMCD
jgi:predicted  nucleic acid-binding Zn-ribbon protein